MPDDRVSIDNLTTAPDLGSNDVLPVVHEVSGVKSTFKATLTAIGTFINKILNYSADLQTTNKTVIGAINELHNGGGGGGMSSDIIADTYDDTATYNTGDYCIYNDGLYVCDDDNVTGAWDSTKWTSIQVMSSIPTNATQLPIESGSYTNTKDYIDSGITAIAPEIYTYSGKLLNDSANTHINGYGTAIITLSNGIAKIDFTLKIETNSGTAYQDYGINRNLLVSTIGKTITPVQSGSFLVYNSTGEINTNLSGYGGCFTVSNQFWKPARVYNTSGDVGSWSSDNFTAGRIISGTCYGTYT